MGGDSLTGVDRPIAADAPAARIFLSYRRHDPNARVGRLYDRLVNRFGAERVFIDVDSAVPAENFERVIDRALSASRVLIAVIGPTWETATNSRAERRLDNPDDYVRYEIAKALQNDDCAVLPVLWGVDTVMPAAENLPEDLRPLAKLQAIRIDDDDERRHFEFDAEQVMTAVARLLGEPESRLGPDIVLTPPDLVMDPGYSGQIAVVARNVEATTTDVALNYDGPEWARLGPGMESRAGGRELRSFLTVSPPRSADLPPRAWPYAIELRDQRRELRLAQASGTLTIVAFRDTHVDVEPTGVDTRRSSSLSLTVRNGGNVHLHGRVETKARTLSHGGPDRITLQPGAEETYEIPVSAPSRRLVGRVKEHPVTVSVAVQGEPDPHVRRATVRQRPLLPAGVVLLMATILVALLGFSVWKALDTAERRFPYVIGRAEEDAIALLRDAGFDLASIHRLAIDTEKGVAGVVVRTDPKVGDQVRTDAPIQLFFGEDSLLIAVPEVFGMTEAEAIGKLKEEGFTGKLTPTEQVSTEADPGHVIGTDPPAKSESLAEDEIVIFVAKVSSTSTDNGGFIPNNGSNGEAQDPTIPNVLDETWADAAEELEEAHFEPSRVDESSDTVAEEFVIRTDPAPGTVHPAGTNVIVVVSTGTAGPDDVVVPNVVGRDVAEAEAILLDAGLGPVRTDEETCQAPADQVQEQDVPPGTWVPANTDVTITVAREPPEGCGGG